MEKRVSSLETRVAVVETRGKVSEKRIQDLEDEVKFHGHTILKMQGATVVLVVLVPILLEYLTK